MQKAINFFAGLLKKLPIQFQNKLFEIVLKYIPFWLLIVVMFRDLVIVAGYLVLVVMGERIPMRPIVTSKINTFMQISLMVAVLIEKSGLLQLPLVLDGLVLGVLVTTIVSGFQYVWVWGIRRDFGDEE